MTGVAYLDFVEDERVKDLQLANVCARRLVVGGLVNDHDTVVDEGFCGRENQLHPREREKKKKGGRTGIFGGFVMVHFAEQRNLVPIPVFGRDKLVENGDDRVKDVGSESCPGGKEGQA